jgi:hypothetical protein
MHNLFDGLTLLTLPGTKPTLDLRRDPGPKNFLGRDQLAKYTLNNFFSCHLGGGGDHIWPYQYPNSAFAHNPFTN